MTVADSSYTQACSSDPARASDPARTAAISFSREHARALSPTRRASLVAATLSSGIVEESRTPFRDIRISFIHTNFGTNLDLRKLPAARWQNVRATLETEQDRLICMK